MLNDTARYVAIRNKTSEVLALANQLYGVDIKPTVSFNLRGKVAGWGWLQVLRWAEDLHPALQLRVDPEQAFRRPPRRNCSP